MEGKSSKAWTPFAKDSDASPPRSSAASVRSLRKRTSFFFGRSRSDASSSRQSAPTRPATAKESDDIPQLPHGQPEDQPRRKTEPLDATRTSILGTRKQKPISTSQERSDSKTLLPKRNDSVASSTQSFKSQDECS
jgi:hypothetical protein